MAEALWEPQLLLKKASLCQIVCICQVSPRYNEQVGPGRTPEHSVFLSQQQHLLQSLVVLAQTPHNPSEFFLCKQDQRFELQSK